jgi:N-acetylmuramic acid 6-phosphate etherase
VSEQIDRLSAVEIVDLINCEDTHVSRVVASLRESIAAVAEMIAESITGCCEDECDDESNHTGEREKDEIKGRVFYFGAGTSGRLGVLDASEIPPTFSAPREWFQGVIAGGDVALRSAVEGAEDNVLQGELDLLALGVNARDIVIGIASSGTTPYVHGALRAAKEKVHVRQTVLITCNPPAAAPAAAAAAAAAPCSVSVPSSSIAPIGPWTYIDTVIPAVVGPEVLTGSTRMKAGTATKLILNQLSTVAMILSGKSLGNLMVDLRMSNEKLKRRAVRILRTVIVGMNEDDAKELLLAADGKVKLAIAMYLIGRVKKEQSDSDSRVIYSEDDKKYAEDVLKSCHGRLAAVIQKFA